MYAILSLKIIKWKVGAQFIMGFDNDSIIKMITDYGITIIIASIFIYIIIRVINIGIKWTERSVEARMKKLTHDETLELRAKIGSKVQFTISEYLEEHHGHRIQVVEFSNSVMSVAYLPFRYMTCTYEVCSPGVRGYAKSIDKISTSLFTQFFDHLQDSQYCEFDINSHETLVGGAMCDLMKDMQENKCICAMMKTAKGLAIGYIAFYKDDRFTDEDRNDIDNLASSIGAMLCVVETGFTRVVPKVK